MDKTKRIVFFGTPEIAATELEHLVTEGYNIVGVVTNTDKQQGRGKQILPCEVKVTADKYNLNVLQPVSMKNPDFIGELKQLQADIFVVVAFRMMPKEVYTLPKIATFNLHTSLLPQYRGAAPINWAIINGEKRTGLTTFLLNDKIDCGDILLQTPIDISDTMTCGELYDIMSQKGKKLICDTIDLLSQGNYSTIKQNNDVNQKPAPKIFKSDTYIDWNKNARDIINFIRGLSPYPCAKSVFVDENAKKEYEFKIFEAKIKDNSLKTNIGNLWIEKKSTLLVQCADGTVELVDLQLNGKKRMAVSELVKGLRFCQELKNLRKE